MKIRKLHLKNIGVFDDQEIVFQPCKAKDKAEIHIFTGQNGSGKSTILMALANAFDWQGEFDNKGKYLTNRQSDYFYKRFRYFEFENDKKWHKSQTSIIFETKEAVRTFGDPTFKDILKNHHGLTVYNYSKLLNSLDTKQTFEFAVFAFSGYRQLKFERIEAIYEPKNFNPLSQSLEFVKDYSQSDQLSVNQLIANNFSKRWIESSRDPKKSEKFKRVLTEIEDAIFKITGWKIEFDLQTEPINLIARVNGEDLDFDVLPDGLRSLISWMADLLGRVDLLKWQDDLPINEKNLILFLDEIEIHLHPAWQRKVLPVVQKLFKNSQIFISTHSPFVINSVDDAWVYKLELENGKARVAEPIKSEDGFSYRYVLREVFGITEQFGVGVQKDLDKFYELRDKVLENGSKTSKKDFLKLAKALAEQSEELNRIVQSELRQISEMKGKEFSL